VTHRWRVVHIDADGVLGREAILGVRRPHFIGRRDARIGGESQIEGGRIGGTDHDGILLL
jgi:hypothetical protein